MSNILVLAGSKQSGKSSTAKFLHGHILKKNGAIKYFDISDDGKLLVNASYVDENGITQEGEGEFDIERRDYDFYLYAEENIWPYIKLYNFADNLKQASYKIFGIDQQLLWGTNEDKSKLTDIKFSDMAFAFLPKEIEDMKKNGKFYDYMSVRDFLKAFGTRVCRRIQDKCWLDRCVEQILADESPLAIIGDCRFVNEVEAMKKIGAKIIRFTRKIDDDADTSETQLDDYKDFDCIIDNQNMSIHQKNIAVFEKLKEWGWVEGEI